MAMPVLAISELQVRGTSLPLSHQGTRESAAKKYGDLFLQHFVKIQEYERENDMHCIAIQFIHNAALGAQNVMQMHFHCRQLEDGSKIVAVYSTFTQKEVNYFRFQMYPPLEDYSYHLQEEQTEFSH